MDGNEAGSATGLRWLTDGTMIVDVRGEVDYGAGAALRELVLAQVGTGRPQSVAVDLAEVTFLDSSTLGVLLALQETVRAADVPFAVVNPSPLAARVLEVTGLRDALVATPAPKP